MRTRGVILILCIVVIGGIVVGFGWTLRHVLRRTAAVEVVPARSQAEIHRTWVQGVRKVLAAHDQDRDALKARDALLALSVRTDDQDVHLALVLALQGIMDGKVEAAQKLVEAQQAFTNRTTSE